ncbi:hypothetical protein WICPIJ_001693, partial [Wickerhamomyces pijperi]
RRLSFIKDDMSTGEEDEDLMKDIEEEEQQQIRTLIKFLIQRERFLEKLYSEDESSSASSNQSSASPAPKPNGQGLKLLEFLRREIQSLVTPNSTKVSFENVKPLTSLLFDKTSLELQTQNGWLGDVSSSRAQLIKEISKNIDPSEMIPKFRLFKLLEQAIDLQKHTNLYNFPTLEQAHSQISLFEDIQWDRSNFPNSVIKTLTLHNDEIWYVLFNHTGSLLVSCSKDGTVLVYDVKDDFKLKYQLEGHEKGAMYASFSPSGSLLLTCGMQGQAYLWDITTGKLRTKLDVLDQARVWCCDWINEDEFILGSPDKIVVRYNHVTETIIHKWEGSIVNDLKLTADRKHLICATYSREMEVYDLLTGVKVNTIAVGEKITSITASYSQPNTVLVNVTPNEVQLWDWVQGVLLTKYVGHNQKKYIVRSCFGYDETLVLSGSEDGRVFLWNKEYASLIGCYKAHKTGNTNSVAWCPDTNLLGGCCFVTGGDDGKVQIWGPEMFAGYRFKPDSSVMIAEEFFSKKDFNSLMEEVSVNLTNFFLEDLLSLNKLTLSKLFNLVKLIMTDSMDLDLSSMFFSNCAKVIKPTNLEEAEDNTGNCDNWLQVQGLDGGFTGRNSSSGLLLAWLWLNGEVVRGHPFVIDEFGQVGSDRVWEHNDNLVIFSQFWVFGTVSDTGTQGGPRGTTNQDTFFSDQSSGQVKGVLVIGLVPFVNQISVQHIWDEIITDTFNFVGLRGGVQSLWNSQDGTMRISTNDFDLWILFFQIFGNTGNSTTSTSTSNQSG